MEELLQVSWAKLEAMESRWLMKSTLCMCGCMCYYIDWVTLWQAGYSKLEQIMEAPVDSSDSEQQFLQPIAKCNPPNELINKNYGPDEKPILKLMKLEKPEQGTCVELKKKYRAIFECEDTLGYQYSYSLANEIVYLKFNNQNYFTCRTKSKAYRLLSGMFLPAEKLLAPEVRTSKNIYRTLPDIEFVEYKTSVEQSFAKNCRSTNIKTVRFSSNYESGNLFAAMKKKQFQYDLIIQNDINSKGNTQWFNFVAEFNQEGVYKFNLLNFTKPYSQFQDGMKIVYFSYKENEQGAGWTRGCNNIKYQEGAVRREDSDCRNYYCLKFQYLCSYPTDKVIFAYFYPYTSLDLEKFMKKTLYRKINVHMRMEKIKVCETISGLPVYAISIQHKRNHKPDILTVGNAGTKSPNSPPPKTNKSVVFMARQHPGQTQGSFITEGIIDILMENGELDYLKKNIDFYIFPMVNVDGTLYGNYRTNLSGADLNRIWRSPRKEIHPEIYYIKKYLSLINKESPISLIIDLHGHSKSLNSFFYGNPTKKDPLSGASEDSRLFPYVCSKKIKQISFAQSTFSISEDKKNSARVVMAEMFPKAHVYTLESSFHGWRKDHSAIHEYTPEVLRKIGRELVVTYLQFDKLCDKNPQIKQKWFKEISQLRLKADLKGDQSDGGSDSEAELDLIDLEYSAEKSLLDSLSQENAQYGSKSQLMGLFKKDNKQNFVSRNLLVKTQIYHRRYNRYNRKMISPDESTSGQIKSKREQKEIKTSGSTSQGFLSIVKIKTINESDLPPNPANSDPKSPLREQNEEMKFTKESIIQKLKRKKIRIEEAVNSSSGMKTFLKTMGIPLDRKLF